jgi:hypothetical protein
MTHLPPMTARQQSTKATISAKWPLRTSADCEAFPKRSEGEGGRVQPVLGAF